MSLRRFTLFTAGAALLFAAAASAQTVTVTPLTRAQFITQYKANLAAENAGEFERLTDAGIRDRFEELLDALLADDLQAADAALDELELLDVHYELIEITDAGGDFDVLGFREAVGHTTADFRGWGQVLVRPGAALDVVYQAPHPIDDEFTESIVLEGFLDDCCAALAFFSGSRRDSNGDGDGDGEPDSDVANDTENLFHALTEHVAGLDPTDPPFFVQIHSALDRTSTPTITGSDGDDRPPAPPVTSGHPLVAIDDDVDADGHVLMGVCGFSEGSADNQDGDYLLCATGNSQGDFLETVGLREQFMHFEIERAARDDWNDGSGAGFDGIRGLFRAIRELAGPELAIASYSAPVSACRSQDVEGLVALTLENRGAARAGLQHVGWFLSTDPVLGPGDMQLSLDQVSPIDPGASAAVVIDFLKMPSSVAFDDYFLLALVDHFDQVTERLEGNNVAALPVSIGCTTLTDFEDGLGGGWEPNESLTTCTTGFFSTGTPQAVENLGVLTQLQGDHTKGDGRARYTFPNTGSEPARAGNHDVDGGQCVIDSPVYGAEVDSTISLWYYFGQRDAGDDPTGDFLRIEASVDGAPFTPLVSIGDVRIDAEWTEATMPLDAGESVRFRVRVSDGTANGDLVEAGIDDVSIAPR